MKYLERKRCIHRDLASRNCLLGRNQDIKISDFGMSKHLKVYRIRKESHQPVAIRWSAPESLKRGVFSTMSDSYSYGVLLWEIYTGKVTKRQTPALLYACSLQCLYL